MNINDKNQIFDILNKEAKNKGIDELEVKVIDSSSLVAAVRLQKLENIERSKNLNIQVRIIKNKKQASITTNINSLKNCELLMDKLIDMVEEVPFDKFVGLPENHQYAKTIKRLDLIEPRPLSEEKLIEDAKIAEHFALSFKNITNSEGANRAYNKSSVTLLSSKGFTGSYSKTNNSLSVIAIAGKGTNMERDYEYTTATHSEDLEKPEIIGSKAAKNVLARLQPRKIKSCKTNIVFSPRVGSSLLSTFSNSINGNSIARGTSFLLDKLNKNIFKSNINIVDDPHVKRGIRSKPFDNEGLGNSKMKLVSNGKLCNWFLDTRSAKQLKLKASGNPGPSNIFLDNGEQTTKDLLSSIKYGLYVTDMMGMSFNQVTGDYSRGASGFIIENGEISYPVSEITIAGNMLDMFVNLTPCNDLKYKTGMDVPTILIENMMLAGL